jgi:hypothetical protein
MFCALDLLPKLVSWKTMGRVLVLRAHLIDLCHDLVELTAGALRQGGHLQENGPFFECFPYLCPESVLVK